MQPGKAMSRPDPAALRPVALKPLTTLRFAAALWVVAFSYWPRLAGAPAIAAIDKGYLGVELFFVLSGFILSHVYLEAFGQKRFSYGGFLWARLARIYPLHLAILGGLAVLGGVAALKGIAVDPNLNALAALPAQLTLTNAWGLAPVAGWNHPAWSISAEWFAYLLFPAFASLAWALRFRPRAALIGAATLLVAAYLAYQAWTGELLTTATFRWGALRVLPAFGYGAAVYLAWRAGLARRPLALCLGSLALLAGLIALAAPEWSVTLAFGGLILGLAALPKARAGWLAAPLGLYLGEVSFAVYMVSAPWEIVFSHGIAPLFGLARGPLPWPVWLLLTGGVLPAAMAAHHLIERPARDFLRRLKGVRLSFTRRNIAQHGRDYGLFTQPRHN